jgi:carbonic anhydrase/acetyltransferase-like protein (isoleucine patch superfamily)
MIRSLAGKTPVIHPSAFVSEFAYVVGDVEIGEGSSVWPGSVIRGESKIVIGRFTCIRTTARFTPSARAPSSATTWSSATTSRATRRWSATALPSVTAPSSTATREIGEHSVVASGAVVLDGAVIPPNSLAVGVPAKVTGPVRRAHAERFRGNAEHYAELAAQFKAEGL